MKGDSAQLAPMRDIIGPRCHWISSRPECPNYTPTSVSHSHAFTILSLANRLAAPECRSSSDKQLNEHKEWPWT